MKKQKQYASKNEVKIMLGHDKYNKYHSEHFCNPDAILSFPLYMQI